jgi:hypothetical protein
VARVNQSHDSSTLTILLSVTYNELSFSIAVAISDTHSISFGVLDTFICGPYTVVQHLSLCALFHDAQIALNLQGVLIQPVFAMF